MLDLDLLVPSGRLADASRALSAIGFGEDTSCYSRDWYALCLRQLPPLEDEHTGVHLDVHGALVPPYSPFAQPEGVFWSNTIYSRWPGAQRLAREWAIWHLVWHAWLRHARISGVRELAHVDLLALLANSREEPIDWTAIVRLARLSGTAFALSAAIGRLARAPGAGDMAPVSEELAELAARQRGRELRFRWVHRARHVAPFIGVEGPRPPDAWIQFLKRPLRTLSALAGSSRR